MYRTPLTLTLIVLNVAAYALSVFASGYIADIPSKTLIELGALYGPFVVFDHEWWRLITAMFLHGGAMHIAMNMISLYIVGRGAELYFSKSAYVALYLFSGLVGAEISLYAHPADVAMGASGAIFGIFGALIGFFIAHRHRLGPQAKEVFQDFAAIIGINVILGLAMPSIDMSAHIGGFFTGLVGGVWLALRPTHLPYFIALCTALLFAGKTFLETYYATVFS